MGSALIIYAQVAIITAGNQTETLGEVFPIMQQIEIENVSLGVPRFEVPSVKPIVKEKPLTFWQKLILTIKKLFK